MDVIGATKFELLVRREAEIDLDTEDVKRTYG